MSTNYPDTLTPGRVDIVIFPSGNRSIIGRQSSYPYTPESAYLGEVQKFVSSKQGLEHPEKFTGYYTIKDGVVSMTWAPYAGEIEQTPEKDEAE